METRFEWQYKSANPLAAAEYKDFNVSELLAQVLVNRGISAREYSKISYYFNDLRTEYLESIVDLEKACEYFLERTDNLKNKNKKIYIFADYDADGITSAAIANITLKKLGFNPVIHVPERSEGYGLSRKWSEELSRSSQKSKNTERPLVMTFDNGITKADEVELLRESGIDVIVTDHHEPCGKLPDCIVVDPKKDSARKGVELCGAAIAYLFFYKLLDIAGCNDTALKNNILALATIGTIADMMQMSTFNAALCKRGLEVLNREDFAPLSALKRALGLIDISSKDIGFSLAACINGCGQLGKARFAYSLFDDVNADEDALRKIAVAMCHLQEENKAITKKAKQAAEKEIECGSFDSDKCCIYTAKDLPLGTAGKVAQHISQLTGKPAIVFPLYKEEQQELRGSARSGTSGLNLLEILQALVDEGKMEYANGHGAACGCGLKAAELEYVKALINKRIGELEAEGKISPAVPAPLLIDAHISMDDINLRTYKELIKIPFSMNMYQPLFLIEGKILDAVPSKNNPRNICYTVMDLYPHNEDRPKIMKFWAWNLYPEEYSPEKYSTIKIVGSINRNFMSPSSLTMDITDMKFE